MEHRKAKRKFKRIGRGAEFRVFRIGNGRVLKRPTTARQKLLLLKRWYPKETASSYRKMIRDTEKWTAYSQRGIKKYVLNKAPWLIGNPIFLENLRYTQDNVTTLGKYLNSHTYKENKLILQSYVDCIFEQWTYGFYQKVANFTINYGVDKKHRVILIDLGELTFSKANVAKRIKIKRWLANSSYTELEDKKLKKYYARLMNTKLTLRTLNRLWKRKRNN